MPLLRLHTSPTPFSNSTDCKLVSVQHHEVHHSIHVLKIQARAIKLYQLRRMEQSVWSGRWNRREKDSCEPESEEHKCTHHWVWSYNLWFFLLSLFSLSLAWNCKIVKSAQYEITKSFNCRCAKASQLQHSIWQQVLVSFKYQTHMKESK